MNDKLRFNLLTALDDAVGSDVKRLLEIPRPSRGWLRAVREAFGFSQRQLARSLGMKQQPYAQIEGREIAGTITLQTLRKAASALDCEVVYMLVPRSGQTFREKAHTLCPALGAEMASEHSMALEGQGRPQTKLGNADVSDTVRH